MTLSNFSKIDWDLVNRKLFAEQGHLILASKVPHKLGTVLPNISILPLSNRTLGQPCAVIATSSLEEYLAQEKLAGKFIQEQGREIPPSMKPEGCVFYRIGTD